MNSINIFVSSSEIPLGFEGTIDFIGSPYIDKLIREKIKAITKEIRPILEQTRHDVVSLKSSYHNDNSRAMNSKKIREKGIESIIFLMISMGKLLWFRARIFKSLNLVLEERVPFVMELIRTMYFSVNVSGWKEEQLKSAGYLSQVSGCFEAVSDSYLATDLLGKDVVGDIALWGLLPAALAAGFTTNFWKTTSSTSFHTTLGGFVNNAHCIIKSLLLLTSMYGEPMKSIVPSNPSGISDEETKILMEFIAISSFFILEIKSSPELDREYRAGEMILFINHLICESAALSSVSMENYFPYTLIRTTFVGCHEVENAVSGVGGNYEESAVEQTS